MITYWVVARALKVVITVLRRYTTTSQLKQKETFYLPIVQDLYAHLILIHVSIIIYSYL
jgi:hypothetical protein